MLPSIPERKFAEQFCLFHGMSINFAKLLKPTFRRVSAKEKKASQFNR
jgi:hypothetical protein